MSDIYGNGWGSDHDWARGGANQVGNNYMLKGSYYECRNCAEKFMHSYDLIPDVFQAMQHVGVPEHCAKAVEVDPGTMVEANTSPTSKLANNENNKGRI